MIKWPGGKEWSVGLAALESAGVVLAYEDNVPQFNVQAAQSIVDALTLDQVKAELKANISAHAKALRDTAVSGISPGEMASWAIKVLEATKYAATGNAADAPMLSAEAQARGITLSELVGKVSGNSQRLSTLEAVIGGVDGKHRDAVAALTSFEAVAAYDFSTGWPEV